MIQFILGRSGTGKTTLCIKQIIDNLLNDEPCHSPSTALRINDGRANRNLVFLVPEQATYQAERAILSDNRIKGYSRLHILSFQRLCYLIFGKNLAARPLNGQARDMIVHRLLCENAEKLRVFSSAAANTGSAVKIATVLAELQQHSKSPDDVDKLIEQLKDSSELTAGKLTDINLIYKQYLAFVEGNFLNNDNQLNLARDAVAHTPFLKDCRLWVDGFAGFTTSEMLLLTELLKVSSSSKIALCIGDAEPRQSVGGANPDWSGIFEPTEKTYTDILSLIKQLNLPVEEPVMLNEPARFRDSKALAHLEKNIFSLDPVSAISAQDSIRITACAKTRLEVDYVARQICSLVREKGFRWRDCAVIASDIDEYRHYIQAVFNDFDIPFFIDRRRDLQQYPVVELVTSALKIATDRFTGGDVLNYLKSDLAPVGRADVDKLENYCLAFGIEGNDWLKTGKWDFAPPSDVFSNDKIDKIRSKAVEHLLSFRNLLQNDKAIDADKFCAAIFTFLDSLNVRSQLADWIKIAFEKKRLDEAQLHQQFFAQFAQLMDDFAFVFKTCSLSTKQYASIIASALGLMTVALIPPALDQVLVGSIERSRHPDLKAVFLIGATQDKFPIPVYYDNILTDSDRKITADMGFDLSRTGPMQLIERRYLAYIAFTRPSKFLYITYPLTDEKGGEVKNSFLIDELKKLFTDLEEGKYFGSGDFIGVLTKSDLTALLAWRLGRDNLSPADDIDAKCKWLIDEIPLIHIRGSDWTDCIKKIKSAIDYKNTAELDNLPLQNVLYASATKLRSFASCPFKYFAEHILELQERQVFELEPLSLGLFFHKVLDLLFDGLKSERLALSNVNPDLLERLVDKSVERLLIEDLFLKSFKARTKHNNFVILSAAQTIKDAVLEFSRIASAGSFSQIASETGFGGEFSLPAVEIEIDGGKKIRIEGKIDRIDAASIAGENYCLVIDYKTSQTPINWSLFKAGLDLQLPIYLLAVKNKTIDAYKNLIPAGAFYFQIKALPDTADLTEIGEETEKIKRKPTGIFDGTYYKFIDGKTDRNNSLWYNFHITKDGLPYGHYETRSALKPEHFSALLSFAENKIKEFGKKMLSGVIDVNPYKYASETACKYCPYKSLCRFDWQINNYAPVKKVSKTEFFEHCR